MVVNMILVGILIGTMITHLNSFFYYSKPLDIWAEVGAKICFYACNEYLIKAPI